MREEKDFALPRLFLFWAGVSATQEGVGGMRGGFSLVLSEKLYYGTVGEKSIVGFSKQFIHNLKTRGDRCSLNDIPRIPIRELWKNSYQKKGSANFIAKGVAVHSLRSCPPRSTYPSVDGTDAIRGTTLSALS